MTRRFSSPLLKIRAVCEQQSRLAEIELGRAINIQNQAEQRVIEATAALDASREDVARSMRMPIISSMLLGLQQHLVTAKDRLEQARTQVHEAAVEVKKARDAYQAIQSKVDGLTKQLDRQHADYRKQMFKEQQSVMDDGSVFRWTGPN